MKIKKAKLSTTLKADALVLGEFKIESKNNFSSEFKQMDTHLDGLLTDVIKEEDFKFDSGSTLVVRTGIKSIKKVILVGLGEKKDLNIRSERKAIAAAIRKAKAEKIESLAFNLIENADLLVETAFLVSYEFNKYKNSSKKESSKSKKDKKYENIQELIILEGKKSASKSDLQNAEHIAKGVCLARDLVWEPACVLTPTYLANVAKKIKGPNIKVKVMEKSQCQKLGMGAYLAVAQGSDEPPKFIEITYSPKGKIKKHVAIVGKGVTFDSGGLSLKPSKAMEMMKEDMSGAASVLGVMTAISKIQPKGMKITMIIAATENMPSGKAYRPGDVITAMNGKTIEVNNTDAEGRLTLADAVHYVSQKNPDEIIDIATLTGACMVALGNVCAGLMTNNQELLERVKKCSEKQGELMWQLPLYEEYRKKLKSPIADYLNAGSGGQAGAQNGGLFVQEFVGIQKSKSKASKNENLAATGPKNQIPWLHIDIAGPCWYDEDQDWSPRGASGIPVRTLLDYILSH